MLWFWLFKLNVWVRSFSLKDQLYFTLSWKWNYFICFHLVPSPLLCTTGGRDACLVIRHFSHLASNSKFQLGKNLQQPVGCKATMARILRASSRDSGVLLGRNKRSLRESQRAPSSPKNSSQKPLQIGPKNCCFPFICLLPPFGY
jgi:hypothetical protein